MGNELKRDMCPEKYYAKGSIIKDTLQTVIALVIVAFFSGSMFNGGGLNAVTTILIEVVFVFFMSGLMFFIVKGMKKRLSETYISVCENGVCGICPLNGYKNKTFEMSYSEITKMTVKGERLFLYSGKSNVILTLKDAAGTAALIKDKNVNL